LNGFSSLNYKKRFQPFSFSILLFFEPFLQDLSSKFQKSAFRIFPFFVEVQCTCPKTQHFILILNPLKKLQVCKKFSADLNSASNVSYQPSLLLEEWGEGSAPCETPLLLALNVETGSIAIERAKAL
jgi:hypothetical protein